MATKTAIVPILCLWLFPLPAAVLAQAQTDTFSYMVDRRVRPLQPSIAGRRGGPARRLAAIREGTRRLQEFVETEVLFRPRNAAELDRFLRTYSGTVVDSGMIPALPPLPPGFRRDTAAVVPHRRVGFYTLRVDPARGDIGSLIRNGRKIGATGRHRLSSSPAAQVLAIIAAERARGEAIGLNVILRGDRPPCLFKTSFEHPVSASAPTQNLFNLGYNDGFTFPWMEDAQTSVAQAWQYLAANQRADASRVGSLIAIIDGGFAVNADFRWSSLQYDFVGEDYDASGTNPGTCTNGAPCPWHGTQVFSTAGAVIDNQFGATGSGGQLVWPLLFKVDNSFGTAASAVATARNWMLELGLPGIINMSFSGSCGFWCWEGGLDDELEDAVASNIIPVASAGNGNGQDVEDEDIVPCREPGVICVGAIGQNRMRLPSSNRGSRVDIWAPGAGVMTTLLPNSGNALTNFGATSAAAPFVAGVIAMMRAVHPGLTRDEARTLLRETANVSTDPTVRPGFVNALAAVRRATVATEAPRRFEGTGWKWHDSFAVGRETPLIGDFNGDCRADIATVARGVGGGVFVAIADGSQFFGTGIQWLTATIGGEDMCAVGDFNGDGRDDILMVQQATGDVRVALSNGSRFSSPQLWRQGLLTRPGQSLLVGNFNGLDGEFGPRRDDVAVVVRGNDPNTLGPGESRGEVYVALSTGGAFGPRQVWHRFFAPGPEAVAASDFDGDGRDDLAAFLQDCCVEPDRGDVYVALSRGNRFADSSRWYDFFSFDRQQPRVGDVTGDFRADIINFVRSDRQSFQLPGEVEVGVSQAGPDRFVYRGLWHDSFGFGEEVCAVGDFNGDGACDIVTFTRGDAADVYVAMARP